MTADQILRKLYSYLKTNLSYEQFYNSLKYDPDGAQIPLSDYNSYLNTLVTTKALYTGILWKTENDFFAILKKIADKTPSGYFPTWRMIQSAFANPDNFKPSLLDYAKLAQITTKQVATTTIKTVTGGVGLYFAIAIGLSLIALMRGKK